ncbi:MAG: response regulator [Phycisphaeraceae bacterium]
MPSPATSVPPHVLLIEDDADARASLADILELDGYIVEQAGSIAAALVDRDWTQLVAIITDRRLPDGHADARLQQFKSLAPDAAIIVVTGYRDLEGAIACLQQGAEDYLIKPVNPDALRLSLRRIVERRRTMLELQASRQRLQALFNSAIDVILLLDNDARIIEANPAVATLLGYPPAALAGKSLGDLLNADDRRAFATEWKQFLGNGAATMELLLNRRDGTPVAVDYRAVAHIVPGLHMGIARDLSERRRLERQVLDVSASEQQRIGRDLHDGLGQELTGIAFLADVLRQKLARLNRPEAADAAEITQLVNQTIDHARALVRGLCPVVTDADGLMSALEELAEVIHTTHRVACRFLCEEPVLVNDPNVAAQAYFIAREAVNNAVKHARARHITLRLKKQGDRAVLSVQDDGVGIIESPAAGRGMQIMPYRARMIAGSLDIASTTGKGTAVTLTFNAKGLADAK